jgi:hypothetical protein
VAGVWWPGRVIPAYAACRSVSFHLCTEVAG